MNARPTGIPLRPIGYQPQERGKTDAKANLVNRVLRRSPQVCTSWRGKPVSRSACSPIKAVTAARKVSGW
jgi:hypothetical protein